MKGKNDLPQSKTKHMTYICCSCMKEDPMTNGVKCIPMDDEVRDTIGLTHLENILTLCGLPKETRSTSHMSPFLCPRI